VPAAPKSFSFRPRFRGLAWSAVGVGGAMAAVAASLGAVAMPLATGVLGVALGAYYLRSPTWKIAVTVDDDGFTVGSPTRQRFRLAWADVVRVIASTATSTCFVDGGSPDRSLLVPGDGAPAPYDIANRKALVGLILARVPADKVQIVSSLDAVERPDAPK
jgi:hypothetical protein